MSCVRTGAQHGGEPSAGGGAYGPENRRRRCVSAGSEGQDSPAREIETRNVQRQTARMRTYLAGDFAVTISTFEARPRSDCLQGEGEILGEDGRDHSTDPLRHRFGQAAVDKGRAGNSMDAPDPLRRTRRSSRIGIAMKQVSATYGAASVRNSTPRPASRAKHAPISGAPISEASPSRENVPGSRSEGLSGGNGWEQISEAPTISSKATAAPIAQDLRCDPGVDVQANLANARGTASKRRNFDHAVLMLKMRLSLQVALTLNANLIVVAPRFADDDTTTENALVYRGSGTNEDAPKLQKVESRKEKSEKVRGSALPMLAAPLSLSADHLAGDARVVRHDAGAK